MKQLLQENSTISVIMLINSSEDLELRSTKFFSNKDYFSEHVELIIVDSECSSSSSDCCLQLKEQYPTNVFYYPCSGMNLASCYNFALQHATGTYIHFTKDSIGMNCDHLQAVESFMNTEEGPDIVCLYPTYRDIKNKEVNYLSFKRTTFNTSIETENQFNLYLFSYFFKKEILRGFLFNEQLDIDSELDFLLKVLLGNKNYSFLNRKLRCDEMLETDFYNYASIYYREWYIQSLNEIFLPLLKANPDNRFLQHAVTYLIELRFAANRNDRNKNILLKEELPYFFEATHRIFQYIDDDILVKYTFAGTNILPKYMGTVLLRMKYDEPSLMPDISLTANELVATYNHTILDKSGSLKVNVMAIDYEDSSLIIDGELTNAYIFDYTKLNIFAQVTSTQGVRTFQVQTNDIYSLDKYFGLSMKKGYMFQVRIPVHANDGLRYSITFGLQYGICTLTLPMFFIKSQARLINEFSLSYWRFGEYALFYKKNTCELIVKPCTMGFLIDRELKLMKQYCKNAKKKVDKKRSLKSVALRCAYWITKPFFSKKKIWMTFDQLFKGGDNGEYFFKYVSQLNRPDINIYYVINKNSDDYKRLKKDYKNVLAFNSIYHKLISLHTDMVFATRVDVKLYCGYGPELEKYFRGLLDYKIFCLQHGLTIQRIAQYQNRLFDNTRLYFCVSKYEIKNLLHPVYGYNEKDLILTGAPRYDGLINNDKRQILITPTWRRNVTAGTNKKGYMHDYSPNFKHTEYFKLYNALINDERLIACAKQHNYRLIYLLHPILSPQIDDFTKNDYVEIIAGANNDLNYETILTESSLMVTDYSGVQFDFAYMRKPIIYYHPDTLPPQYDEGGLNYSTMGFGPVCKNHQEIVDSLCSHIENECRLESLYKERADEFFAFSDHNNCKRVFEAVEQYQKNAVTSRVSQESED